MRKKRKKKAPHQRRKLKAGNNQPGSGGTGNWIKTRLGWLVAFFLSLFLLKNKVLALFEYFLEMPVKERLDWSYILIKLATQLSELAMRFWHRAKGMF